MIGSKVKFLGKLWWVDALTEDHSEALLVRDRESRWARVAFCEVTS